MGGTASLALTGASFLKSNAEARKANAQAASVYQQRLANLQRQQQADENKRLSALEKVSASQRVRYASQGLNPSDGSSGALLSGLQDKTQEELEAQAQKYGAERSAAQNTFAGIQAANLQKRTSVSDLLLNDGSILKQLKNWF